MQAPVRVDVVTRRAHCPAGAIQQVVARGTFSTGAAACAEQAVAGAVIAHVVACVCVVGTDGHTTPAVEAVGSDAAQAVSGIA